MYRRRDRRTCVLIHIRPSLLIPVHETITSSGSSRSSLLSRPQGFDSEGRLYLCNCGPERERRQRGKSVGLDAVKCRGHRANTAIMWALGLAGALSKCNPSPTMMVVEVDHVVRGGEPELRPRGMIASRSVNMVRHPRGSYIVILIAASGVATPENKVTHWLSSINKKVGTRCRSPSYERILEICASPFMRLAKTSRHFALGASSV